MSDCSPRGLRRDNLVLNHKWGVSAGADRVWEHVAAIAPSFRPWERVLVALQAFFDESYTPNGCFVLAGYVATAEAWAAFSKEWEELLPLAPQDRNGVRRFRMSEMAQEPERALPFLRVIEKYALMSVSYELDIPDLERARERIWIPTKIVMSWGDADHPYSLAVIQLLSNLWSEYSNGRLPDHIRNIIPDGQKVDFIFDEHTRKDAVLKAWDAFMEANTKARSLFAGSPRFEDDTQFLPLQAGDLLAWNIRRAYETDTMDRFRTGDFGWGKAVRMIPRIAAEQSEDQVALALLRAARRITEPGIPVFDDKYHPRPPFETEEDVEARNREAWQNFVRQVTWLPRFLFRLLRRRAGP